MRCRGRRVGASHFEAFAFYLTQKPKWPRRSRFAKCVGFCSACGQALSVPASPSLIWGRGGLNQTESSLLDDFTVFVDVCE